MDIWSTTNEILIEENKKLIKKNQELSDKILNLEKRISEIEENALKLHVIASERNKNFLELKKEFDQFRKITLKYLKILPIGLEKTFKIGFSEIKNLKYCEKQKKIYFISKNRLFYYDFESKELFENILPNLIIHSFYLFENNDKIIIIGNSRKSNVNIYVYDSKFNLLVDGYNPFSYQISKIQYNKQIYEYIDIYDNCFLVNSKDGDYTNRNRCNKSEASVSKEHKEFDFPELAICEFVGNKSLQFNVKKKNINTRAKRIFRGNTKFFEHSDKNQKKINLIRERRIQAFCFLGNKNIILIIGYDGKFIIDQDNKQIKLETVINGGITKLKYSQKYKILFVQQRSKLSMYDVNINISRKSINLKEEFSGINEFDFSDELGNIFIMKSDKTLVFNFNFDGILGFDLLFSIKQKKACSVEIIRENGKYLIIISTTDGIIRFYSYQELFRTQNKDNFIETF